MFTEYINTKKFFPKYAPGVTNYYNKKRGLNGRGAPLTFSFDDLVKISAGVEEMKKDIDKEIELKKAIISG